MSWGLYFWWVTGQSSIRIIISEATWFKADVDSKFLCSKEAAGGNATLHTCDDESAWLLRLQMFLHLAAPETAVFVSKRSATLECLTQWINMREMIIGGEGPPSGQGEDLGVCEKPRRTRKPWYWRKQMVSPFWASSRIIYPHQNKHIFSLSFF